MSFPFLPAEPKLIRNFLITIIQFDSRDPISSDPIPPIGSEIKFTFQTLPESNDAFANQDVVLGLEYSECIGCKETQKVEIFFPRDERNHPGAETGITPNWYYYWAQITISSDLAYGGPSTKYFGEYDYSGKYGPPNKCIIYDLVVNSDTTTGPGGKAGIDCFGQVVSHERKHKDQFLASGYPDTNGDGIPDYDSSLDSDSDWLSDSYEIAHGFNEFDKNSDSEDDNGNGILDPGEDTNGNGILDGDSIIDREEEPIQAEFNWPNDSQNDKDWACPGKNCLK